MRRKLIPLGVAAAVLTTPVSALAAADPAAIVLNFHKSVVAAAKAKSGEAEAERAVRKDFDVEAIEASVLADRAGQANAQQRARLGQVIVRRLAERVLADPDVKSAVDLTVTRTRPAGEGAWLVSTRSGPPTASLSLTWRLHDGPSGPRIVDVLHDGGSLASLERRKLEAALKGRDLDSALNELEGRKK